MTNELSNALADAVAAAAPSVVQVQGRSRPASGVVVQADVVLTTMRALGHDEGARIRRHDGTTLEAAFAGWDPATGLAVLEVGGLDVPPSRISDVPARVGHLALAIARSWSNAVTASAGIVSVIGGPLSTGRRRSIQEVIRTTAPMHDGFSGGAFVDPQGGLIGIATSMTIRGLNVVIPAAIALQAVQDVRQRGSAPRGYLGIAGQPAVLPAHQQTAQGSGSGLLVAGVTDGGPAAAAGILVGDVVTALDGHAVGSPQDLWHALRDVRAGHRAVLRVLRGGQPVDIAIQAGERPGR